MLPGAKPSLAEAILNRYTRFVAAASTRAQMLLLPQEPFRPQPGALERTIEHIWHIQNCITQNTAFHLNLALRFAQGRLGAAATLALGREARREAMTIHLLRQEPQAAPYNGARRQPPAPGNLPPPPAPPKRGGTEIALPPESSLRLLRQVLTQRDIRQVLTEHAQLIRQVAQGHNHYLGDADAPPHFRGPDLPQGEGLSFSPPPPWAAPHVPLGAPMEHLPAPAAPSPSEGASPSGPPLSHLQPLFPGAPDPSAGGVVAANQAPPADAPTPTSRSEAPAGEAPRPVPPPPLTLRREPPVLPGDQGPRPTSQGERPIAPRGMPLPTAMPAAPMEPLPIQPGREAAPSPTPTPTAPQGGIPAARGVAPAAPHLSHPWEGPPVAPATMTQAPAPVLHPADPQGQKPAPPLPPGSFPGKSAPESPAPPHPRDRLPQALSPRFPPRRLKFPTQEAGSLGGNFHRIRRPAGAAAPLLFPGGGTGPAANATPLGPALFEAAAEHRSPAERAPGPSLLPSPAPARYAPADTVYHRASSPGGAQDQTGAALPEITTVHRHKASSQVQLEETAPRQTVQINTGPGTGPEALQLAVEEAVEQIDLARITDRVYREIANRLRTERKKRGL